jgi:hypothetical protein
MKRCPVCGLVMRTVALTALEEQAQTYPHVSAAWRCSAWPACDTRRVESKEAVSAVVVFTPDKPGSYSVLVRACDVEAALESRPRDSDIGGPAWGTRK